MNDRTCVLLVEHDANDVELIRRALLAGEAGALHSEVLDSLAALEARLEESPPDLILADYRLEGFTALEVLAVTRRVAPDVPVIVVTGSIDEETAVQCMLEGAADYLLKTRLHRLRHAAAAAIERARLRAANERQLNELVAAAERQLGQLALLGAVLESSSDPIFSLDREGRYTSFNQAHATVMKALYGSEVRMGRRLLDLMTVEEDRARAAASISRALGGEHFVEQAASGDGVVARREHEIWHYPVVDGSGEVTGVAVMARDVTERKRTEEMMLVAQKQESLGVLAGGVAHDFNNLLTVIIGNQSLALADVEPGSKTAGYIASAQRAAERAAGLTKQMLAYTGRGRFLSEKLDLSECIRRNAALFEAIAGQNVRLVFDLATRLPPVLGDPEQIDQIVLNLITNAAEAIGTGRGSITIATREEARPRRNGDEPALHKVGGRCVVLGVSDDGPGMDDETVRRAFDPFFSTKFTGRGLGLAAVSGIVRAHHGEIDLRTAPGLGARFRIVLPAVASKGEDEEPAREEETPTVLVIDDEPDVLALVRAVLESDGFEVLAVSRGEEGIEAFRRLRGSLAVVVLDLSMPDIGAEKVLPELRRIDSRVPVVLSSGFDADEAARRIGSARVEAFLGKPYQPASLLEVVRRVRRERGASRPGGTSGDGSTETLA